jgi:hypothetical protein
MLVLVPGVKELLIKLNANCLSAREKRWLGAVIVKKVVTKLELMERFGLSRVLLNKYAKTYRDGREHRKGRGRPTVLDDVSDRVLMEFLDNEFDGRICVLRDKIRREYLQTLKRRGKWDDDDEDEDEEVRDIPELSGRSLYKYMVHCKLYCDSINKKYND